MMIGSYFGGRKKVLHKPRTKKSQSTLPIQQQKEPSLCYDSVQVDKQGFRPKTSTRMYEYKFTYMGDTDYNKQKKLIADRDYIIIEGPWQNVMSYAKKWAFSKGSEIVRLLDMQGPIRYKD